MEPPKLAPQAVSTEVGGEILKVLGISDKRLQSLSIHFESQELVMIRLEYYLDEKQGGEVVSSLATSFKNYCLAEKHPADAQHISNIYDHRLADALLLFGLPSDTETRAILGITTPLERSWESHLSWINANVIGPPMETPHLSGRQLEEKQNMIGIYEKDDEDHQ